MHRGSSQSTMTSSCASGTPRSDGRGGMSGDGSGDQWNCMKWFPQGFEPRETFAPTQPLACMPADEGLRGLNEPCRVETS